MISYASNSPVPFDYSAKASVLSVVSSWNELRGFVAVELFAMIDRFFILLTLISQFLGAIINLSASLASYVFFLVPIIWFLFF